MSFKYYVVSLVAVLLTASIGCRSPYHQDRLATTGGIAGAVAGTAIGEASGNPAAGAVIGTFVGAVTGSAIGQSMDESEARNQALIEQQLGRQLAGATTFEDVIAMSQATLSDTVIISHIQNHGVFTQPTPYDLIHLKNSGVSDNVLAALQKPPVARKTAAVPVSRPIIIEEHHYEPHWFHHNRRQIFHEPRHHNSIGFSFH
ncbi:MAG: glycine zipper domain-containing protein [Pirellulales bacterium]